MTDRVLIKDLISIPERVHSGDFVLKLSSGVAHAEETVRDYVVTPQLKACFDNAMGFVRDAVKGNLSKACYLHGSFGSGKSHFMAVLNLLLAGNVDARSIPELADTVDANNEWTDGRRFLMVPYHMVGATSLDNAILGQYAEHVQRLHPDAPLPAFFLTEKLFTDARGLRATMGDEPFFKSLGGGGGGDGGWGLMDGGGGWDGASFDAAMAEGPQGTNRQRLVSDLVKSYYQSYAGVASAQGDAFVSLDDGLAIMSQHAKSLGYDAVILFLDELILWLATRAADTQFVAEEGSKLSKLVEAANADRPVPLVSFVARQRDLRELVGDAMAGSLQLQFADVLKYWEARFHRITLEDRNLPVIARRRLLRPVSDAAAKTLEDACQQVLRGRKDVVETLLTAEGEREMFSQVYPFSPALVDTLVAVSSVLQRERTALKLMLQLLVDRRDDLELGQLIPVGDLFDAISDGDEPFSDGMRLVFENAKKLYRNKLLPLLERQHGTTWSAIVDGSAEPARATALRNDARLVKTLLLAALVPEEKSLRGMTSSRLAALNHGTVHSPIAGREGHTVLTKIKGWAAEIGEIKVTDDSNPLVSIHITGVDTDPIIQNAKQFDNPGNRKRKIREVLFSVLGIEEKADLLSQNLYPFSCDWRGTKRDISVSYDNVREMSAERLSGQDDRWTVIFDFPFDEEGHSPSDDMAVLADYRASRGDAQVLAWLPSFLSPQGLADLGRLVILDELFKGDRFGECARHLSPNDREQARSLLRNQQAQLQQRVLAGLAVAYGIADQPREMVSAALAPGEHLQSLDGMFQPQMPVGADLKAALVALLDRLFSYLYPAHPRFEVEVRTPLVRRVWTELEQALTEPNGRRHLPERRLRDEVRAVVEPLRLASVGTTHMAPTDSWRTHFSQHHAREPGPMTVGVLRSWINQPKRMGLPVVLENLIILAFAQQTNRVFQLRGVPLTPSLEILPDEAELRELALPPETEWTEAVQRAASLFGLTIPSLRNSANVVHLVDAVRSAAAQKRQATLDFAQALEGRLAEMPGDDPEPPRLKTALACRDLVRALATEDDAALVHALATAPVQTSATAMAKSMAQAQGNAAVLGGSAWTVFRALSNLGGSRGDAGQGILTSVQAALAADEHVIALRARLDRDHEQAVDLLAAQDPAPPAPAPAPEPEPGPGMSEQAARADLGGPVVSSARVVASRQGDSLSAEQARTLVAELEDALRQHPDAKVTLSWSLLAATKVKP